jgi:hypothetical protein
VDGLNDELPRISWLPFRNRSDRASDVWGVGSIGYLVQEKGHKFPLQAVNLKVLKCEIFDFYTIKPFRRLGGLNIK